MKARILGPIFLLAFSIVAFTFGCSGKKSTGSNPLAPFQPQITNTTDDFQFQVTGAQNVTTTQQYTWQNTGSSANINQSCSITGGTATLTVFDPSMTQVYSNDLAANGTFQTNLGASGFWRIKVEMTNCTGTLNFRAQKP